MNILDPELILRSILLTKGQLIIYTDEHGVTHLISKEPIDMDKEYDDILILTYQDLGIEDPNSPKD